MIKKFVPCIYLKNEKAVKSFDCLEVINDDPVLLAEKYNDDNCDEIIVFDLSEGDNEHEKALDVIKDICNKVDVPVIGAGNVKRMEDIKKLLYAGCKKAALNFSKQGNIDILEEVSLKFGKEKIVICYKDTDDIALHEEPIKKYAQELVLLDRQEIKESLKLDMPTIYALPDVSLDKILDLFRIPSVSGLTGEAINKNTAEINNIKKLCAENAIEVSVLTPAFSWNELKKNNDGLVPVIIQDYRTEEVLMMAYMNEQAYYDTLSTGKMHYYSRSRDEQWLKGETSGHFQFVKSLTADCDLDTILAKVKQIGAACHTGSRSCFFNEIAKKEYTEKNPQKVLDSVYSVIADRKVNPREGSYTNYLFDKGIDKILKKCGEEATEIVIAAKNPNDNEIVYEISDFLYHVMVLMVEKGVSWEDITDELSRR
ncbi:MAG: bifunctional phosphoribosyl-AMP cyclohydrolase/phosphoribosyl-ATP diphosphatase HisIE [Butyrivibrio sp.]|jgi:phosphoribosyl-ATP pyrophosphohydrolase/phosphoribosyl-AMP cyclohydrolase|nr:bifunctional phosphoribosyl-AMP cyclohydrolase/phosphoribosyl-ATP diphosphatase HisIE [Butyrivibrio sp.]